MIKHTLVPNNFYFMKPNKIVKKQISLFAHDQTHLTADFFFFPSPFEWSLFTIYHEFKKKKSKARPISMHLKMVKVK